MDPRQSTRGQNGWQPQPPVALGPRVMRYYSKMKIRAAILTILLGVVVEGALPADKAGPTSAPPTPAVTTAHISVLTGDQVLQILDQTVNWYRTLGTQQQASTQPSDLLILYANQQTATQIVSLAFDIARANAELLSSEASTALPNDASPGSSVDALESKLKLQRQSIQAEMEADRQQAMKSGANGKSDLDSKRSELQGELDMINARINLLDTMTAFASESNAKLAGANALKAHIDAIAASVPTVNALSAQPAAVTASPPAATKGALVSSTTAASTSNASASGREGIWGLAINVLDLGKKGSTILAIEDRTVALEDVFSRIRSAPTERLKTLSEQSDALAIQADNAHGAALKDVRDQLDTLAWLFQQTSAILVPLSKEGVLLEQYRHNLRSWHDTVVHEYHDALRALGIRLGILLGMLAVVFAGSEVWRRVVVRYALEPRRRHQLLLIGKLTVWALVLAIIALTFITELSAFATFAGLITAGIAVAMQSVLVSIVGYFLLIGKYGLRVGDRVQIGAVTGEIIDIGLIRMHLMELSSQGPLGATGRTVAFPNSIVFQAAGGLFRQIPGVNFVWHETTLVLPPGRDYAALKDELLGALRNVMKDYHEDMAQQTKQIERTTASTSVGSAEPQVQLHFSASGVEAVARYPVQLQHEAETDERVSQALSRIISRSAEK
jgi:small-conductance mechanosensitive channel